jgi:hypothetical protein
MTIKDAMMTTLPKPIDGTYDHFGHVLRHYRETLSERIHRPGLNLLPQMQVTATALLKCVEQSKGLVISQASYSEIENGLSLPRDPEAFLNAVAPCLAIEEDSIEWWTLVQYLSHGLIAQKLGGEIADQVVVTDEEELQDELKERKTLADKNPTRQRSNQ